MILIVVAIVLAILAPIAARLVQLAVSRQREYLADASSVELTRNPAGLERALAAIATDKEVLEVANRATQHLYFTNPIKKFEARSNSMFSTHPAIVDRINRLRELPSRRCQPPGSTRGDVAALTGSRPEPIAGLLALRSPCYPPARRRADGSAGPPGRDSSVGRARD